MNGKRYKKVSLALGAAALAALTVAGGLPSANAKVISQNASATALIADTALFANPIQSTTVTATGTSGPNTHSEVSLSVGSLLEVNALNVSAQTKNAKAPGCQGPECQGAFAHATSEVANASLNLSLAGEINLPILDGLDLEALLNLTASVIKSECRLDAHNLLARTTILDADLGLALLTALLGSADLELDALLELEPNTTIDLLDGLLRIVINEQIIDWVPSDERDGMPTDDHAAVTVNALHVTSELLDIDVIIAQSNCEITGGSNQAIDLGNSWVTNGSTLELNAGGGAQVNVPLLPVGDLIELLDNILLLPVQEIIEIVDEILPLPVGQILTNTPAPSLNLGALLNLELNSILSASLLGRM